LKSSDSIN